MSDNTNNQIYKNFIFSHNLQTGKYYSHAISEEFFSWKFCPGRDPNSVSAELVDKTARVRLSAAFVFWVPTYASSAQYHT